MNDDDKTIRQADHYPAHDYGSQPKDCLRCRIDLGSVNDQEPHGPPPFLGWIMIAIIVILLGGAAITINQAIVHSRSVNPSATEGK